MGKGPSVDKSAFTGQQGAANSLLGTGIPAINNASGYWQSLLGGGQASQNAVAPYAEQIRQMYSGTERGIQNSLPQGGEKNLALAQLPLQRGNDIARLYAGVGPTAASNLGQIGLGASQMGGGLNEGLINYQGQRNQAKGQALGGLGSGLGMITGGMLGNKSRGGGGGSADPGGNLFAL